MTPDFDVRLGSVIRSLREVVTPALEGGSSIALEQLGVALGHLEMMRQQWARLPAYAQRCADDMRALTLMLEDAPFEGKALRQSALALGAPSAPVDEGDVAQLWAQRNERAAGVENLIHDHYRGASEQDRKRLTTIVLAQCGAEALRDRIWFAATGLDPEVTQLPSIDQMLGRGDLEAKTGSGGLVDG